MTQSGVAVYVGNSLHAVKKLTKDVSNITTKVWHKRFKEQVVLLPFNAKTKDGNIRWRKTTDDANYQRFSAIEDIQISKTLLRKFNYLKKELQETAA